MPFAENITYLERNHCYGILARSSARACVFHLDRREHRCDETEEHYDVAHWLVHIRK